MKPYSIIFALSLFAFISNAQIITTIAGNGTSGYSGDGGPATSAQFYLPGGIALDQKGNIYVADIFNHCIRKIDTSGIISTFAGTGVAGFSGDNGPATSAKLNQPIAVACDKHNNVYISDGNNNRLRKVDTSGTIHTFVGSGSYGFGGDGGPALSATISQPLCVAVDSIGNVFFGDYNNHRIRKIDTNNIITTVIGSGTLGYGGDGGPALSAKINSPDVVYIDRYGNIYLADWNNVIRMVDTAGIIHTKAGIANTLGSYGGDMGLASQASFNDPEGVVMDSAGNLLIPEEANHRLRMVTTTDSIFTVAGTGVAGYNGDGIPAYQAQIGYPAGIAIDKHDNIYITEGAGRVRKITPGGTRWTTTVDTRPNDQRLFIYPNPAADYLTIEFENYADREAINVEFFNSLGENVKQIKINSALNRININDFPSGIYSVHLKIHNEPLVRKLVVK
ncbi:MAG: NHL domain-containing protein [Bacteroidia bacterium]